MGGSGGWSEYFIERNLPLGGPKFFGPLFLLTYPAPDEYRRRACDGGNNSRYPCSITSKVNEPKAATSYRDSQDEPQYDPETLVK